ncbi:MAG: cytochrome-c oxidase, cbb3-type subunit III [Hydrogenophilales bacterium RIFOXYA1_FULL_63_33]|nr:MAG: cytochrome-c oxidase, cbb3-type subunit III [Hydrogenophilales bacterium RIFOXYA1_FULL_63_33]
MSEQKLQSQTVQTTGHAWDGDLQEYNNPLPVWWVYTFYVTVVFALVYWTIYPSWPFGKGWIGGLSNITYVNSDGETKTHSWNTRALLLEDMNRAAIAQKPYFDKVAAMSYAQVAKDPDMNGFILSAGKALFSDNCAPCHQAGGQGVVGFFPNLTDDDWLYGGSFDKIHETITGGRHGYMPTFSEVLSPEQIDQLANYVASLSGIGHDATKAAAGNVLFHSETAACYYCHGADAKGRKEIGSANLTDNIWLWANVPAASSADGKVAAIRSVIASGLNKGVMPAWAGRLSPEQIKVLTVYVHELGGGQ